MYRSANHKIIEKCLETIVCAFARCTFAFARYLILIRKFADVLHIER